MSDETDVQLPPPPKVHPASREARARRAAEAARASLTTDEHTAPNPVEVREKPTRAEATRRERRRRENNDHLAEMKLGVSFKFDPAFEYRWINEGVDGQRLYSKTVEDDWEKVNAVGEPTDGVGSGVRRAVGQSTSGPLYAHLCRKPKDWHEADRAKAQQHDDRMMSYIKEGRPPTAPGKGLTQQDHVYGEGVTLKSGLSR